MILLSLIISIINITIISKNEYMWLTIMIII